ncbi:MAG: hypothetical protein ACTSYU_04760 [Promethearchaeota archaeon]
MGRTLLPFRPALEIEISSWQEYRRGLRPKDRTVFDQIMNFARYHADAGSLAAKPILFEIILLSIVIEQQKDLSQLKDQMNQLRKQISNKNNFIQ